MDKVEKKRQKEQYVVEEMIRLYCRKKHPKGKRQEGQMCPDCQKLSDYAKIALINDIRFQSRRSIDWNEIEECLKEYVGEYFEIIETSERVYTGTDFPDEFSHSKDTKGLKGANVKAKANIISAIKDIVEIASDKTRYPDYNHKYGSKAKFGWYRYDTRFGIPVYGEDGELERYNIFAARMLVRCDADGKLYLYDLVRTKKETSKPLEQ